LIQKKAFAKINLALDVLRLRSDGMHDVDLILTPLALHDTLTFELLADSDEIQLTAPEGLGRIEDNLIIRAAKSLQQACNVNKGAHITLDKQIPVAAGLAGGSSDAAATLRGLNELWQLNAAEDVLLRLARSLGADVPYCLHHATMRGRGTGTDLSYVPPMMATDVILFKPKAYGISAKDAYSYIDTTQAFTSGHVDQLVAALTSQDYATLCASLYNSFEHVVFDRQPDLATHKEAIAALADGALMSGSGPTIFAFAREEQQVQALMDYGHAHDLQTIRTTTKK